MVKLEYKGSGRHARTSYAKVENKWVIQGTFSVEHADLDIAAARFRELLEQISVSRTDHGAGCVCAECEWWKVRDAKGRLEK